jgi:transcriptional/translational regulatory protein YebC/TACO1
MDKFLNQKYCDRCGGSLKGGRIMSMFNEECLCMSCKEKETKDPNYKKAVEAEQEEIRKGNFNYKGIRGKQSRD